MIEKIVLDYLAEALDPVPAYMMEPDDSHDDTFVVIEKTGSGKTNHIKSATFAIQSYAPSLYQAATLNEAVKDAMEDIITLDEVTRCALNSDYPFVKESTKQPRYQAVFDLTHY